MLAQSELPLHAAHAAPPPVVLPLVEPVVLPVVVPLDVELVEVEVVVLEEEVDVDDVDVDVDEVLEVAPELVAPVVEEAEPDELLWPLVELLLPPGWAGVVAAQAKREPASAVSASVLKELSCEFMQAP